MRDPWYVWASPFNGKAYRYGPYVSLTAAVKSMRRVFHDRRRRPRLDCRAPGAWIYTPPRKKHTPVFSLSIYRPAAAHLCELPRREVQWMLPMDGDAPVFIAAEQEIRKLGRRRRCTGLASGTA
jgi:hypothetical protein